MQNQKKFLGRGHSLLARPLLSGEGTPLPTLTHSAPTAIDRGASSQLPVSFFVILGHVPDFNKDKRLANAERPCDCSVLCIRLKSLLCSCVHSIYFRHDVNSVIVTSALSVNVKKF